MLDHISENWSLPTHLWSKTSHQNLVRAYTLLEMSAASWDCFGGTGECLRRVQVCFPPQRASRFRKEEDGNTDFLGGSDFFLNLRQRRPLICLSQQNMYWDVLVQTRLHNRTRGTDRNAAQPSADKHNKTSALVFIYRQHSTKAPNWIKQDFCRNFNKKITKERLRVFCTFCMVSTNIAQHLRIPTISWHKLAPTSCILHSSFEENLQ